MLGRSKRDRSTPTTTLEGFETHIAYLKSLAERLEGTDRSAVNLAADLLGEVRDHFRKTGYLK